MTTTIDPILRTRIDHYRTCAAGDREEAARSSDAAWCEFLRGRAAQKDHLANALEADAIDNNGAGVDVDDLLAKVRERLPKFAAEAPETTEEVER